MLFCSFKRSCPSLKLSLNKHQKDRFCSFYQMLLWTASNPVYCYGFEMVSVFEIIKLFNLVFFRTIIQQSKR